MMAHRRTWRQLDRWQVLEDLLGRGHGYSGEAHGIDARGTWNAYVDIRVDIGYRSGKPVLLNH